jgi:hypothetical protein
MAKSREYFPYFAENHVIFTKNEQYEFFDTDFPVFQQPVRSIPCLFIIAKQEYGF